MPWFVYANHEDQTHNIQCTEKPFTHGAEAEKFVTKMRKGCFAHDNYCVSTFEAEDVAEAERIADAKRPHALMNC